MALCISCNNNEKEEKFVYNYGFNEIVEPFWTSDIIYNESVLLLEETVGGVASGKLMVEPQEIYSVRDYSLKREWVSGKDFEYKDGKLIRLEGSNIPYFTQENMHGRQLKRRSYGENGEIITTDFPDTFFQTVSGEDTVIYTENPIIFEHQIFVTYKYKKGAYTGPKQEFLGDKLPLLQNKIRKGEDINILLLGDSISCGGCSSSNINSEPFMKNWYELFADAIAAKSGGKVNMNNSYSVGGQISEWSLSASTTMGLNRAQDAVKTQDPDLVMIAWGMNDGTWHDNRNTLASNVQKIIDSINFISDKRLEFMVLGTCMPNDNGACYVDDKSGARTRLYNHQPYYAPQLKEMVKETESTIFVDMGAIHNYSLINKKYADTTVNNLNHPNDFVVRMYAMNLASSVIKDFGK